MSKLVSLLLVCCFAMGFTALAQTLVPESGAEADAKTLDEYLKVVRGDLEARRDSAMRAVIELKPEESKTFWAIKKAYDEEERALGKKRLAVIDDYRKFEKKLTPEMATQLGERTHQIDMDRLALRKRYFDRISKEVSPVVAVQFSQLERQFETMGDLKLATRLPLAVR